MDTKEKEIEEDRDTFSHMADIWPTTAVIFIKR
jgi:hypothetical protein